MLIQAHELETGWDVPPGKRRGSLPARTWRHRSPRRLGPAEKMAVVVDEHPSRAVVREDDESVVRRALSRAAGEQDRRSGGLLRGGADVDQPPMRAGDRLDDQQVV